MSVVALRQALDIASQHADADVFSAIYELLLATPVLLPTGVGSAPVVVSGPAREVAVPIFLDEAALRRWSAVSSYSSITAQRAARVAADIPDAMLVVDLGSRPGSQPIGRKGVELLAQGTYPGANNYRDAEQAVADFRGVLQNGDVGDLFQRIGGVRVFTIGEIEWGKEVSPGVFEILRSRFQCVEKGDGASYLVAWPTPSGSFAFMPESRPLTISLGQLAKHAVSGKRGLVIDPNGKHRLEISPTQLAAGWQSGETKGRP